VKLDPVDNQRLARLCGALDENLRQIESALDVTIARRGAKFTVRGEHAQRAAQALEHFYDRAGGDLTRRFRAWFYSLMPGIEDLL